MAVQPSRARPLLPASAAARRRLKLRGELFKGSSEDDIWIRANFIGFTSVPRTMPLVLRIIDGLDAKKAARVYFDLWCRAFDDFFIDVRDEHECAYSSGYSGQRAIRSWRERVEVLVSAGFVRATKTKLGRYRHVLILDPHKVIEKLNNEERIDEDDWLALEEHLIAIGAK
jgi:hypothetical protein